MFVLGYPSEGGQCRRRLLWVVFMDSIVDCPRSLLIKIGLVIGCEGVVVLSSSCYSERTFVVPTCQFK